MKKLILTVMILFCASVAWGVEFNIKRIDAVHSDSEKERRGCYKRGDIINVQPDGEYKDKPHLTILAVKGLDEKKVEKLMESWQEPITKEVTLSKDEYEKQVKTKDITINDKAYSSSKTLCHHGLATEIISVQLSDGKLKDSEGNLVKKDEYLINCKILDTYQRRRFSIPENLMQEWFPDGVIRKELSIDDFKTAILQFKDKTNDSTIKDTSWKTDFLSTLAVSDNEINN